MIDISFDTSELVEQVDRIAMLDNTTLAEMRLDAVNVVSLTVRKKSIDQTHAELNLSRDYIEARISCRSQWRHRACARNFQGARRHAAAVYGRGARDKACELEQ